MSILGSVIGAISGNKGARKSAQYQVEVARMNNDLARDFRKENTANLSPFMDRGDAAGQNLNALLGLGGNRRQARRAFRDFRNSNGYQFRFNEGMDALNNGYAAKGTLRSGAAMKDFMRYGQDFASNEFGRYLGYLGNQQGVGMQGAGAIAGVGLNALSAMTQNNQNAADARSNSALIRANNNQNMWSQIDEQLSSIGSSFGGGM